MDISIKRKNRLRGIISVPGDKSLSHRALLLGSIAEGTSKIINLSPCLDVLSTMKCLKSLGIKIQSDEKSIRIFGRGLYGFNPPADTLDAGNSGTTVRLLSGILASQPFKSEISGDRSLKKRPMKRIISPLRQMKINIEAQEDNYLPIRIQGGNPFPIHYNSPLASAQVKSCVLLAGLFADGITTVTEPSQSRDHTERLLQYLEADVVRTHLQCRVKGGRQLKAKKIIIPGDISSAAYFMTASLLLEGSDLTIKSTGVNPTRTGILEIFEKMNARIFINNYTTYNNEPAADIHIKSQPLKGTKIDKSVIPKVIDEIPILGIAATQAEGETQIIDAGELRVKETDRIHATAVNLKAMGADVTELEDGLLIRGPSNLKGARINSFKDHRIAMAFTIAGLIAEGETIISDIECTEISYPGFYKTLENVYA